MQAFQHAIHTRTHIRNPNAFPWPHSLAWQPAGHTTLHFSPPGSVLAAGLPDQPLILEKPATGCLQTSTKNSIETMSSHSDLPVLDMTRREESCPKQHSLLFTQHLLALPTDQTLRFRGLQSAGALLNTPLAHSKIPFHLVLWSCTLDHQMKIHKGHGMTGRIILNGAPIYYWMLQSSSGLLLMATQPLLSFQSKVKIPSWVSAVGSVWALILTADLLSSATRSK